MTDHILLLETKSAAAQQLGDQLESFSRHKIFRVQTMREACAVVTEQTIDLALLPVTRNDSLVYSLRMLQPDIPIVLVAETGEQIVPERQMRAVNGVVDQAALVTAINTNPNLLDRPEELAALFRPPPDKIIGAQIGKTQGHIQPDRFPDVARALLKQPTIQFVMFHQGQELIGYHTSDNQEKLTAAASLVKKERQPEDDRLPATQIQFVNPEETSAYSPFPDDTLLLYSRPIGGFMMTIGAEARTPVTLLRKLVKQIQSEFNGGHPFSRLSSGNKVLKPAIEENGLSYVLVWKPQISLNSEYRLALQKILPAIALREGFVLQDVILNERFVHVLVSCPPQRTSAWLAQTLKHKSEMALQDRIGYRLPVWAKGYYAKQSSSPLTAAELNRYLMLKS